MFIVDAVRGSYDDRTLKLNSWLRFAIRAGDDRIRVDTKDTEESRTNIECAYG